MDLVENRGEFQAALLSWYGKAARVLPWRQEKSVYRTVVSELMLQQTQVKTVLPYFERWMEKFPDFATLAAASAAEVLQAWEGLGYYSRARNLHRLAQAVAAAGMPRTAEAWRELPGIGPYTAAAISSIAFGQPAACVDGNVVRIMARLTGDETLYRDSASAAKAFAAPAQALIEGCAEPGDHNQAMMELGATLCTRTSPQCPVCPVRRFCDAARSGRAAHLPRLAPKLITALEVVRIWCVRDEALLLHRHHGQSIRLAGLHELPSADQAGMAAAAVARGRLVARKRRAITRYQITELIYDVSGSGVPAASSAPESGETPLPRGRLIWVPLADLDRCALSGPHRRWVREILSAAPGAKIPLRRGRNTAKS